MSWKTTSRVLTAVLVVATFGVLLSTHAVHAGLRDHGLLDQTGCRRCQACGYVGKLDAEVVETDKTCFEVEEKVIVIPRVVFPWQKGKKHHIGLRKHRGCGSCDNCDGAGCDRCGTGCDACAGAGCNACVHNGARVRKIRVIKRSSKPACPVCEYSWSAEEDPCASGCCETGCDRCKKGGVLGRNKGCGKCASAKCDGGCAAAPCDAAPVHVDPQADAL